MAYDNFSDGLSVTMVLPKPLEEYTLKEQEDFCKQKIRTFIDESDFNYHAPQSADLCTTEKQRDAFCRRIYQNTSRSSDYDYLYRNLKKKVKAKNGSIKTITMKQPAKVRHIPVVSSKLRALKSREKMRPFNVKAYAIDREAIDRKNNERSRRIIKIFEERVVARINATEIQRQIIAQKQQMLQQYINVPGAEQMVMQMNQTIKSLQEEIDRELELTVEERNQIQKYFRHSHRDIQELLSLKLVNNYIETHRLRNLFNKAFEEKLITDKSVYYVDYVEGRKDPEFELVRPEYLDYQYSEDCEYIAELGWAVRLKYMSFQDIMAGYGRYLVKEDVDRIVSEMPRQHARTSNNLDHLPDGQYVGFDERNHHNSHNEQYPVYQCFWKEYVAVPALISPNKNKSKFFSSKPDFIKFLTTDEAKKMTNTEAKRKKLKRKGQRIEVRYRVDLWEGIKIGMDTYIKMGKREMEHRDPYNENSVELPFVGKNINRFQQARSLVWETRDLTELINILHYQEELLIALAGVRGIVYDLAQKPDGMTPAEVNYYMKQGIMYIKTVKKNGKRVNTPFNQFQTFDQSLSPSVSLIDGMKQSLINLVSMITGIYNNLEGAVANSDQVGTMKMSIQQSSASVETYYQEHEDLIERALTRLANLYEVAKDHERVGSYVLNKLEQDLFKVPAGKLKGHFKVLINSGLREQEAVDNAKQVALSKFTRGEMQGSQYLALLDMNNIHEMRAYFEESEEKMMKIAQQSQQAGEQAKAQAQQQFIQMQGEMDMRLKQMDAQIQQQLKQIDLAVKNKELELEQMRDQNKHQIEQQKLVEQRHKTDSEHDIEKQYLEFEKQQMVANHTIQQAQLLMQDIKNKLELHNTRSKEKVKD